MSGKESPKRPPQKRPNSENGEASDVKTKKIEELSESERWERLQIAIREKDNETIADLLNCPSDQAKNQTTTKMETGPSNASSESTLLPADESVVGASQELTVHKEPSCSNASSQFAMPPAIEYLVRALCNPGCHDTLKKMLRVHETGPSNASSESTLPPADEPVVSASQEPTVHRESTDDVVVGYNGKLMKMIREHELEMDWKEREEEENRKGYKFSDFVAQARMNIQDIKPVLEDLPVIKFPTKRYRYLSHTFRGKMFALICRMIGDNAITDVTLESITFSALRNNLPANVPDEAIKWFLTSKCEKLSEDGDTFVWPAETILRDTADYILHETKKMPLKQFKEIMVTVVPAELGEKVEGAAFEGVAVISEGAGEKTISYLPPEDLPGTVEPIAIPDNDAPTTCELMNRLYEIKAKNQTTTKTETGPSNASSESTLPPADESVVSASQEPTVHRESTDDVDVGYDGKLMKMIREHELELDWKEREEEENRKGYKFSDFIKQAHMNIQDIKPVLKNLPVIKFPTKIYRYLSHTFRGKMFALICKMIGDQSITDVTLESITFSALRNNLPANVPDEAIKWFLTSRCEKLSEDTFVWPAETILRDTADYILHETKKMPLKQFKEIMLIIVPAELGEKVEDDAAFEGFAVISEDEGEKTISYLPPDDLPDTAE